MKYTQLKFMVDTSIPDVVTKTVLHEKRILHKTIPLSPHLLVPKSF